MILNAIVRNEAANLPRMLASVARYITGAAILDTGSTDDTIEIVRDFLNALNIPVVVGHAPFVNFSQARNAALDLATAASSLRGEYLLLVDADMELIAKHDDVFDGLTAPAYAMIQRSGTISYWNPRLVRRDAHARYVGVTHEYLDIPTERLGTAWFQDHCSGSNRVNKLERDIKLLREDLKRDPENPRSWFYLAQSYKDQGDKMRAAGAYAKRAQMGGWEEEAWFAAVEAGRLSLPDTKPLQMAFNRRPHRVEPLYALASHHRHRGENALAAVYAATGLELPYPDGDELFVDTYAIETGLKEELSIAGFYVPQYRDRGRQACEDLALRRDVPEHVRTTARNNQFFYLQKLRELAPSYTERRIEIREFPGWTSMNPSITNYGDRFAVNVRQVNYRISPEGHYLAWNGSEFATGGDDYWQKNPIRTRNFVMHYDEFFNVTRKPEEICPGLPREARYPLVRGLEDVRIFQRGNELWGHANVRELNAEGWCEQAIFRLEAEYRRNDYTFEKETVLVPHDLKVIQPVGPREHQKNWMVRAGLGGDVVFVYRSGWVVRENGDLTQVAAPVQSIDHFSGSSQLVPWGDGWLSVIHEALPTPGSGKRYYQHRFVTFDTDLRPERMSPPFCFQDRQIEFAAGIALMPCDIGVAISFGVRDEQAWIATLSKTDVDKLLA